MPTASPQLQQLSALKQEKLNSLRQQNAALAATFESSHHANVKTLVKPNVELNPKSSSPVERKLISELGREETQSLFDNLKSWLDLPFPPIDPTMKLYVEQQLSDLIGFDLTSETAEQTLPVQQTVMSAMPHIKLQEKDSLPAHGNQLEAGLSTCRSTYGWLENDLYGLYLPFHLLDEWSTNREMILSWFKGRKIVVCNPFTRNLTLAQCLGWWQPSSNKPSSGGTPDLIRQTQVWHSMSQGRVLLFFVADQEVEKNLTLGPL